MIKVKFLFTFLVFLFGGYSVYAYLWCIIKNKNIMTTIKNLENVKITTTFDNNDVMTDCSVENENRILTISLGRVSKTWSISLDSKTQKTIMGHNKNLRTYVNKEWDFTVKYFDKKLKKFNKI